MAEDAGYLLGKDVPWKTVEGEPLRVLRWTALATIEMGKVKATSGMPYALLSVETPLIRGQGTLPVAHRLDFSTALEIFENRQVGEQEEILVIYARASGLFSTFKPRLHFYAHIKGHLEEIYDPESDSETQFRKPIQEWHPECFTGGRSP